MPNRHELAPEKTLSTTTSLRIFYSEWGCGTNVASRGNRIRKNSAERFPPACQRSEVVRPGLPRWSFPREKPRFCPVRDTRQSPTVSTVGLYRSLANQSRQGRKPLRDEARSRPVTRRFLSPLTGLGPRQTAFPTAQAVGDFRLSLTGQRKQRHPLICRTTAEFPVFCTLEALALTTSATGRFRFVKVGDTVFPSRASVRGSSIRDTVELLFANRPATHRSTQVNVLSWCSHPGDEVGWVHFRFAGIRESRRPVPRQEAVLRSRMSPCRSIFTTPVCVG